MIVETLELAGKHLGSILAQGKLRLFGQLQPVFFGAKCKAHVSCFAILAIPMAQVLNGGRYFFTIHFNEPA